MALHGLGLIGNDPRLQYHRMIGGRLDSLFASCVVLSLGFLISHFLKVIFVNPGGTSLQHVMSQPCSSCTYVVHAQTL